MSKIAGITKEKVELKSEVVELSSELLELGIAEDVASLLKQGENELRIGKTYYEEMDNLIGKAIQLQNKSSASFKDSLDSIDFQQKQFGILKSKFKEIGLDVPSEYNKLIATGEKVKSEAIKEKKFVDKFKGRGYR